MFISKMVLNKAAVFKEIFAGEYALHQAVWNLFADGPDRRRDFLYRLDTVGKMPLVYAVSSRQPNDMRGLWCIDSKEYAPQIKSAMQLGFTVRVNPTCKKGGKRHDVVMDAKYKARTQKHDKKMSSQEIISVVCGKWLAERSGKNGFKPLQFMAYGYQQTQFSKTKGGEPIRYSTVDITGILEVADEKVFTDILFRGFGSEKSFGCGLMLVKKL